MERDKEFDIKGQITYISKFLPQLFKDNGELNVANIHKMHEIIKLTQSDTWKSNEDV